LTFDLKNKKYFQDLPRDFLSTPFGAALRPTIDNMFGRPMPGLPPVGTSSNSLSSSIQQSAASQPRANTGTYTEATSSLTGPVHIVTNPATFNHFIKSSRAAVALFTAPQTCPPCRVIEPVFDQLAEEKAMRDRKKGAAFAKIDLNVGMGKALATEWGVRATPTFMFFLDGKKVCQCLFLTAFLISAFFGFLDRRAERRKCQ
jgi:thiol-disulfide isomerase/thioredoxin